MATSGPAALFVGAELEDNLSIRHLTSAVRSEGLPAAFAAFSHGREAGAVAGRILDAGPDLVGLSIAFQHRAEEFLELAAELRRRGYAGHLSAGGHVPTALASELLGRCEALDSVVAFDGEDVVVPLLRALDGGRGAFESVPGLTWRDGGAIRSNPPAPARRDLDSLAPPARDTPLRTHVGLPFAPLIGSRGCYGSCRFCAISRYNRARPGPRLRLRSPASVAAEMAELYHSGGARLFCFHDDTFFLPRPAQTRARMDELADRLGRLGVGRIGVVAKARPDAVTVELLAYLRERIGLVRLYVGIENWSARGLAHLGRGVTAEVADRALRASREAGMYGCYNLLVFEPDTVVEDVEENLAGMRRFPGVPVNFCRAEAYIGTPLWDDLRRDGRLRTEGFATDYTIADPAAQALFGIVHQAFRDRNFAPDGLGNLNMSLGYEHGVVAHFLPPRPDAAFAGLSREMDALARDVHEDTCRSLEDAIAFVRAGFWRDRRSEAEFTVDLASRVNVAGAALHARLLDLREALGRHALRSPDILAVAAGGR